MTTTANPTTESTTGAVLEWTWHRGGTATVTRLNGLQLELHSTSPYPPGSPLVATSGAGTTFEVKVRACRKLPTEQFAISASLVNLTRDLRAGLEAALAATPARHG